MASGESRARPAAAAAVVFLLSAAAAPLACAASVEHTFVVSETKMTRMCKETPVTVVNGQFPGPAIEVTEGDSVTVHVVNKSPHNITIHWHGVKQFRNCWADGVPMITQRPILPNRNFTYRFNAVGQEGTLWWHAHVTCLRASMHGAIIIRPRDGTSSYPFPKPHKEIPIIIGEWWDMDLDQMDRDFRNGWLHDMPSTVTMNGMVGDLHNCSGVAEDGFGLDVEPGKTYLLRIVNAVLFAEYYLKIAGHKFTVVAADANYLRPYTTDIIAIAPGETVDALVVADAPPGRYYITALANQSPKPDLQVPKWLTRGTMQYRTSRCLGNDGKEPLSSSHDAHGAGCVVDAPALTPEMPEQHDMTPSFYFHGNLTSLNAARVPQHADEFLYITLAMGSVCRHGGQSCKRGGDIESIMVATMNNFSFELPAAATRTMLEDHYHHTGEWNALLRELPDRPPMAFNFTDLALIPWGGKETRLEPTSKATLVRRFRHGAVVDIVFQGTTMMQSESNPMHLHGHDMFILAQGLGIYNATRDVAKYNLVDPPVRNSVFVPRLGWAAVRFVADNPGVWYMHCHYEFHLSMGMTALFIVEDGPTADTSLPPPHEDLTKCGNNINIVPSGSYIQTMRSET